MMVIIVIIIIFIQFTKGNVELTLHMFNKEEQEASQIIMFSLKLQ